MGQPRIAGVAAAWIKQADRVIVAGWLPFGFLVFLTAFFWAPSRHNYKVIVYLACLMPALLAALSWQRWRHALRLHPSFALVVIYIFYLGSTPLLTGFPDAGDYLKWSLYTLLFLFGVGIALEMQRASLLRLLQISVLVAGAGAVAATLVDVWAGLWENENYRLRGYGTMYNPLRSGQLFGVFAILGLTQMVTGGSGRWWRGALGVATLACIVAVIISGSRSPLLSLVFVGAVFILMQVPGWKARSILFASGVGVTLLLFYAIDDRLLARGFSYRPEIWLESLQQALSGPLWLGQTVAADIYIAIKPGVVWTDTHNFFLAVLFYGGVIGLALVVLAFGSLLAGEWRNRRDSLAGPALLLQLYGLAVLQFDGGGVLGRPSGFWLLFWLPAVLFWCSLRLDRDGSAAKARGQGGLARAV